MIKSLGHAGTHRRVAINVGSGFVPGTNAVVMGAAIAGGKLGWEMIGIRDGFAGLLFPENYPNGGVLALSPELIENLDPSTGGILGQSPRVDPFHAASESGKEVDIPVALANKWKSEGRYELEMKELDDFFARTGYPRTPTNYIIKWLTDYIVEFGIDGYRADTVKHTHPEVWLAFKKECDASFTQWKQKNPGLVLDDNPFYLVGEVYGYSASNGLWYDFNDKKVNYFENGFNSLINFEFKYNAKENYESLFSKYDNLLHNELKGFGVMNYLSSHDDGSPFDKSREKAFESATKLLLSPGTSQVYYGDESSRSLTIEGTVGDATLRSFMNWDDIKTKDSTKEILKHWQKLGKFRAAHPSVGAGKHEVISQKPYIFKRTYSSPSYSDAVVVGLELAKGKKTLALQNVFAEGTLLRDAYSGTTANVTNGEVVIDSPYDIVLLENK